MVSRHADAGNSVRDRTMNQQGELGAIARGIIDANRYLALANRRRGPGDPWVVARVATRPRGRTGRLFWGSAPAAPALAQHRRAARR